MVAASRDAKRSSFIAGLAAGEVYSVYATFFSHALRPPSVYVIDQYGHHHLSLGQIGYIVDVFYWDDLIQLVAVSLLIFALVWWVVYIALNFRCETRSTFQREIATRSRSPVIRDPVADSVPRQDALQWVTGFDVDTSYTASTGRHALDDASLQQTKSKMPILLEAAWEVTDPSPEMTVIVDADHRLHTAKVATSSFRTRDPRATQHHH